MTPKEKKRWDAEERKRLRDFFAAAALTGFLTRDREDPDWSVAEDAFALADAMLAARDRKE